MIKRAFTDGTFWDCLSKDEMLFHRNNIIISYESIQKLRGKINPIHTTRLKTLISDFWAKKAKGLLGNLEEHITREGQSEILTILSL